MAQYRYTTDEDINVISSFIRNIIQAPQYSSTSIPISVEETGGGYNSGGKSTRASANKLTRT